MSDSQDMTGFMTPEADPWASTGALDSYTQPAVPDGSAADNYLGSGVIGDPANTDPNSTYWPLTPDGLNGGGGASLTGVQQLLKAVMGNKLYGSVTGAGGNMGMLLPLLLAAGVMESSKPKTSTSSISMPDWYNQGAKSALGVADSIAQKPYEAYSGTGVQPLSANQQQASALASSSTGAWKPVFDQATDLTTKSATTIPNTDLTPYMNPYLEGVLAPTERILRRELANDENTRKAQAGMKGAFGTDRDTLAASLGDERRYNALSDLYGTAYKNAFDSATNLATKDYSRMGDAGKALTTEAAAGSALNGQDINRLSSTGAVEQATGQAGKDFDYKQYLDKRDWSKRGLDAYGTALRGNPGSTTTTTSAAPSLLGQATGALGALNTWMTP